MILDWDLILGLGYICKIPESEFRILMAFKLNVFNRNVQNNLFYSVSASTVSSFIITGLKPSLQDTIATPGVLIHSPSNKLSSAP